MLDDLLLEGYSDLGTSFESAIDALSKGTSGVVQSIAASKRDAYEGVITTSAISLGAVALVLIAGVLAYKALD